MRRIRKSLKIVSERAFSFFRRLSAKFHAARRAGVPIMMIVTADPAATVAECIGAINGKIETAPIMKWDVMNGLTPINEAASAVMNALIGAMSEDNAKEAIKMMTSNPAECLSVIRNVPAESVIFFYNAHRFIADAATAQAAWNLRDPFKANGSTLVMLAPDGSLPGELRHDVLVVDDPLPGIEELKAIAVSICDDAGIASPSDDQLTHYADTILGLSAFSAEQVIAMSITIDGIDLDALWERKRQVIEATKGLSVHKGKEAFADLGGLANAKDILRMIIKGKAGMRAIVFVDEIDKGLAASRSDSSGVAQDQLKVLLTYMQDSDALGMLLLGPPGTGKTAIAKAAANEGGIPLINLDLGAMKGSLVGESEKQLREAISVIDSITGGRALFIGACNRTDQLPPELRRRFNFVSMFVDLPDKAERGAMWRLYRSKFGIDDKAIPADEGWTGAEIRNCAMKAYYMDCSLAEAATSIVPVSVSAADEVQALRRNASRRYISASKPGLYHYTDGETVTAPTKGRKVNIEEVEK